MMRHHGGLKDEDTREASWEASKGAVYGAAKWGFYTALLGAAGHAMSPIYRGLTIQFKVFIQMSGMVMGGMIEADRRLRAYEATVRLQRRMRIDKEIWENYEKTYEEPTRAKSSKT